MNKSSYLFLEDEGEKYDEIISPKSAEKFANTSNYFNNISMIPTSKSNLIKKINF